MTLAEVMMSTALAAGVALAGTYLLGGGSAIAVEQSRLALYTTSVPVLRQVASSCIEQASRVRVYDTPVHARAGNGTGLTTSGEAARLDFSDGTSATLEYRVASNNIPAALWYRNSISGKEWLVTSGTGAFSVSEGMVSIAFSRGTLISLTILASAN